MTLGGTSPPMLAHLCESASQDHCSSSVEPTLLPCRNASAGAPLVFASLTSLRYAKAAASCMSARISDCINAKLATASTRTPKDLMSLISCVVCCQTAAFEQALTV